MNAFDRYGRLPIELPDLLTDIAAPRVPDYVDDVLAITAANPAAAALDVPRKVASHGRSRTERVSVRSTDPLAHPGAVALLILALVAAGLLLRGLAAAPPGAVRPGAQRGAGVRRRQRRHRDPRHARRTIARSSSVDRPTTSPRNFTRDGTHLIWLRRVSGSPGSADERLTFVVANPDGSNVRQTAASLVAPDWWDISADGSTAVARERRRGDWQAARHGRPARKCRAAGPSTSVTVR
jgi:hypothetical protein